MHKELRYLGNINNIERFIQYLYSIGNCFNYKVSNFYLDDNLQQYSKTCPNSPRFRVRLYEVDELCFGNIELKYRSIENNYTHKEVWNISDYWNNIVSLIPSLAEKQLRLPDNESTYRVLKSFSNPQKALTFDNVRYIDSLIYHRLSCNWQKSRITVDSCFSPLIVPESNIILEWKGVHDENVWQEIESYCVAESITELSKFTLLARLKK